MCAVLTGKTDRKLVWNEEFDGGKIDFSKWTFIRAMNNNNVFYDNTENTATVDNGLLHLKAVYGEFPDGKKISLPESITTFKKMYFKYGYIEMRAKIPFGKGVWPSFWMKTNTPYAKAGYMAETDIFENFADDNEIVSNLHKWKSMNEHSMIDWRIDRGYRYSEHNTSISDFHNYALEWNKETMAFSVDGEVYYLYKIDGSTDFDDKIMPGMDGFHDFAYILMNNELMTESVVKSMPQFKQIEPSVFPVDYYIDYVRLYQKDGEELITE